MKELNPTVKITLNVAGPIAIKKTILRLAVLNSKKTIIE